MPDTKITYICQGPRVQDSNDHVGCGKDVTALIEAVPRDSQVYEIVCPQCQTVIAVRRT